MEAPRKISEEELDELERDLNAMTAIGWGQLEAKEKAKFVQRCLKTGIQRISDQALVEIHLVCKQLYMHVVMDGGDSHKYFPDFMITDAILTWEERIDLTKVEIERRGLATAV
jgi:hypothetical protein